MSDIRRLAAMLRRCLLSSGSRVRVLPGAPGQQPCGPRLAGARVDGLSARTVTLYPGTIVKAPTEDLGSARLTEPTASDVHGALSAGRAAVEVADLGAGGGAAAHLHGITWYTDLRAEVSCLG